jgi:hypothetical protein
MSGLGNGKRQPEKGDEITGGKRNGEMAGK